MSVYRTLLLSALAVPQVITWTYWYATRKRYANEPPSPAWIRPVLRFAGQAVLLCPGIVFAVARVADQPVLDAAYLAAAVTLGLADLIVAAVWLTAVAQSRSAA